MLVDVLVGSLGCGSSRVTVTRVQSLSGRGAEKTGELGFAVGPTQADRPSSSRSDLGLPEPDEMPLASQIRGRGSLGTLPPCDLGLRCPLRNVDLELNEEFHDVLRQAGQPAATQLRKSSIWSFGQAPSQGIEPPSSLSRILSALARRSLYDDRSKNLRIEPTSLGRNNGRMSRS